MYDDNDLIFYNLAWDEKKENFESLMISSGTDDFVRSRGIHVQPILSQLKDATRKKMNDNIVRFNVNKYLVFVDMETGTVVKIAPKYT